MKTTYLSVGAVLLLSACGGSGTSAPTAEELVDTTQGLFSEYDAIASSDGRAPFSQVAVDGGTVAYNGTATFIAGSEFGVVRNTEFLAIGSFQATADFGSGQNVTATADNFFQAANAFSLQDGNRDLSDFRSAGPIEGSFEWDLDIAQFGTSAVADGSVTGTLTRINGTDENFDGLFATGDFYGDNLEFLTINTTGTLPNQFANLNVIARR